jgi:carbon-monoxide dehydrogenase small subunit
MGSDKLTIALTLNGEQVKQTVDANQTLLDLLRNEFGIMSVKKGCNRGDCGACTVLVGGKVVCSCLVLAPWARGKQILTIEGLADDPKMKTLQEAFMENGAVQCGFCTPGVLLSSWGLLNEKTQPSSEEIKTSLEGNLCRCGGYVRIIRAISMASKKL